MSEQEKEDDAIRSLLKRSLAAETEAEPQKSVLGEVQRKLRQRSKGKFYADGWSTTNQRVSYALVAVIMLLVVAIAYFAMGPMGVR
jgi:hypothetical protein